MSKLQHARADEVDAPIELIDTANIPGGGQLRLLRCGPDFAIHFGDEELMGSQAVQSEQALADLAIKHIGKRCDRMLIGGLGMGFTLGAALAALPATSAITVAELVPEVVDWNRGPLGEVAGHPLNDPRTRVHVGDVAELLRAQAGTFDAVLLDVDNGPEGMTSEGNDWLYAPAGLAAIRAALRPGGVLAVWSVEAVPRFTTALNRAGFTVTVRTARARGDRGAKHTIWLARKA